MSQPQTISHEHRPFQTRLAIMTILMAPFGALVTFLGPVCSSWVSINAGTSKRTLLTVAGDCTLTSVRKANKMACRTGFDKIIYFLTFTHYMSIQKRGCFSRFGSKEYCSLRVRSYFTISWVFGCHPAGWG